MNFRVSTMHVTLQTFCQVLSSLRNADWKTQEQGKGRSLLTRELPMFCFVCHSSNAKLSLWIQKILTSIVIANLFLFLLWSAKKHTTVSHQSICTNLTLVPVSWRSTIQRKGLSFGSIKVVVHIPSLMCEGGVKKGTDHLTSVFNHESHVFLLFWGFSFVLNL